MTAKVAYAVSDKYDDGASLKEKLDGLTVDVVGTDITASLADSGGGTL